MKGRSAIRDICRTFKVPFEITDAVAKSVTDDGTVKSIEEAEIGYRFKRDYPLQFELACKLDGQIRGRGQHACGIVVSEHDLSDGKRCALVSNKADGSDLITNWDKDDLEYCGLMKVDVLGLSELQVLQKARQLIGNGFEYEDIDLNDRKCLREFTKGNTVGCFQVGTEGLREYCKKLKIDNFMMLSHATSLYRPGPLNSGMAEDFIERKNGRQQWKLVHPSMKQFVGDTYGLIIYQEQVMQIVAEVAGLGWGIANKVRKVIAKSQGAEKMKEYQDMFVKGCIKNGTLTEEQANEMFDQFIAFGSYSFNRSHSVEYSHITFWDMYLKVYYPKQFYCASLTYCGDTHRQELIDDAWKNGVEIRAPKVGKSLAKDWNIVDGILYTPFVYIKGVGDKTADKVASIQRPVARMGFFTKEQTVTKHEKILDDIRAYDDEELTVQESRRLREYFGFMLRSGR
jgi:DNA polymerase-3 subunit alpha